MKVIPYIVVATFLVVGTSCNKEVNPAGENERPISAVQTRTFTAYTDNGEATRTILNGNNVTWAAGETIFIFDGSAPRAFVSTNTEEASVVTFEGEAEDADTYYAVFPSATKNGETFHATIPVFQTATPGSFDPKAAIAVAMSGTDPDDPSALHFKNAGAAVKFRISNSNVSKIRLEAIGGERLAGQASITLDGNIPNLSMTSESESCVVLAPASGTFTANTDYVIAVAPGTYAGGFRLYLFNESGNFASFSNKNSQTLNRSDLMNFGTMPEVTNWKEGTLTTLFVETFSNTNGSGGHDGKFSGDIGKSTLIYDQSNFWGEPDHCGGAKQCLKFGTASSDGSFYVEGLSISGKAVLNFSAAGWESGTNTLTVEIDGATASGDTDITLSNGTWSDYVVHISEATGNVSLAFYGHRGFLDDIKMEVLQTGGPVDPDEDSPSLEIRNVTPQNHQVGPTYGEASFDIVSNVPWTISADQPFVSLSVTDNHVDIGFSNMTEGASRDVTITVTPTEGTPQSVAFTQIAQMTQYTVSYSAKTSDFANKDSGVFYTKDSGNTVSNQWSFSRQNLYTQGSGDYVQLGKNEGAETLTFSTSSIMGLIKSIEMDCAAYHGNHEIQIKVGETVLKTQNAPAWSNNTGGSVNWTGEASGNISIIATPLTGARAFYLKSIIVEYEQ